MDPKVQSISVFVKFVRPIGYTQNWLLPSPFEELDQNPIFLLEIGPIPFLGLDLIYPRSTGCPTKSYTLFGGP